MPGDGHRWGMVIDIDRCTGCQACVVACWAENNVPINEERMVLNQRAKAWIRVERYWVGKYPNVKARFIPVPCQQCENAPCEPVCPVYATYHSPDGISIQLYNRCVGTRYCANNDPWNVRFFNFEDPSWPDSLKNHLNPDVTVRSQGVMEKCSFCVQRIRTAERIAAHEGRDLREGQVTPACVEACPTNTLVFGDLNDENSQVAKIRNDRRAYLLMGDLGTDPAVTYLKKIDRNAPEGDGHA